MGNNTILRHRYRHRDNALVPLPPRRPRIHGNDPVERNGVGYDSGMLFGCRRRRRCPPLFPFLILIIGFFFDCGFRLRIGHFLIF